MRIFLIILGFLGLSLNIYSQTVLPTQVPGLQLWFAADTGVVLGSGTNVSQWKDLSGNNHHATQATTSLQPTYVSSVVGMNNKPVLRFGKTGANGNQTLLNFSQVNIPDGDLTAFLVYKNSGHKRAIQYVIADTAQGICNGGTSYPNDLLFSNPDLLTGGVSPLNYEIMTFKNDKIYQNGIQYTSTDGPVGEISFTTIGTRPDNVGLFCYGLIAEIIIYNGSLADSTRIKVENYLRNKYVPPVNLGVDIVKDNYCSITLDAGSNFSSYLWSTGATTRTVQVTKTGNYHVRATDLLGLISRDTIVVTYPDGSYQGNKNLCTDTTLVWDTHLPKNKYTFYWQNNSTDSLFTMTASGNYSVTVTDYLACTASYSVAIAIDNFPVTASLGSDTNLCAGNGLYLKSGMNTATSYLWSNGSTNDSLYVYSSGQYSLIAVNVNGCIKKDTINVVVAGVAPTVDYLFDTTCTGGTNHFTDLSLAPSGRSITARNWIFGDGTTLPTMSTSLMHTYPDTGIYKAKLVTTLDDGCANEKTHTIVVSPYPIASFIASNFCQYGEVQFNANAITSGYPIVQWNWNFNDPSSGGYNNSFLQNPTHEFAASSSYSVQVIAQNAYGCADTAENNIFIKPMPAISYSYSLPCKNNIIQFTDMTPADPSNYTIQSYYWNFGDLSTSAQANPVHVYANAGSYNLKYIVDVTNGCKDSVDVPFVVHPNAATAFTYSNTCVNSPTLFTDNSTVSSGSVSGWKWSFGDGASSTIQHVIHTFSDTINAMVKLLTTTDKGCKDSLTKAVYIRPTPSANFLATPLYGAPPLVVSFTNNSSYATAYSWTLNNSIFSTSTNATSTFTELGNYNIGLVASNVFGCSDSTMQTIEVLEKKLDIAISGIVTSVKDNYLFITVYIQSKSNEDIYAMDINIQVNNIAVLKENWTGVLVKGGLLVYQIPTGILMDDESHFICANINSPNGGVDENPNDNDLCKNLDDSKFAVVAPYPNPSSAAFTLPVLAPEADEISISVYNQLGQLLRDVYTGAVNKGVNLLTLNLAGFENGVYLIKVEYRGEVEMETLMIGK